MFESKIFETNTTIINKCIKLVERHSQIGRDTIELIIPLVGYKIIGKQKKDDDPLSKDIISFYETYTSQMSTIENIKLITQSMDYDTDDLMFHIDRSPDSIAATMGEIANIRTDLVTHQATIVEGIATETDAFIEYIADRLSDSTNYDNIIRVVFTCMKQVGIAAVPGINERLYLFIGVGLRIIAIIQQSDKLTDDHLQSIKYLNNETKQVLLGSINKSSVDVSNSFNQLQTFGLIPDEGKNKPIAEIIHGLFGINSEYVGTFPSVQTQLSNAMKLITADTGLVTGLIIYVSKNADIYFDMESILSGNIENGSGGINQSMVDAFNLIIEFDTSNAKVSDMITINTSDTTQMVYILWTNDMENFKVRTRPIYAPLIKKILRKSPSSTIESYNSMIEKAIVESRSGDMISYNHVKYMSFSSEMTEEKYLNLLQSKLSKNIFASIGKLGDAKVKSTIVDISFNDMLLDTVDSTKSTLGVPSTQIPPHCHIIFASVANGIVNRIKKSLLSLEHVDKESIGDAIKLVVQTNDNIYSRVIAGYYLHRS
jgi:hypothetical protein